MFSYLDYYLYRNNKDFKLYLEGVKEIVDSAEDNLSCKDFLNLFISTFITPEKLGNIIEKEEIKDYFDDILYNKEEKTLSVGGNVLDDITKLIFISWLTIFYFLRSIENIDKVKSPFIEKSIEMLSQVFKRNVILSDYTINTDLLEENFKKVFSDYNIAGLLSYALAILSLNKNLKLVKPIILEYKIILFTTDNNSFAKNLFLLIRKIGKFIDFYPEYLSIEIYNNLFAVGIADIPLTELKISAMKHFDQDETEDKDTE